MGPLRRGRFEGSYFSQSESQLLRLGSNVHRALNMADGEKGCAGDVCAAWREAERWLRGNLESHAKEI